ncbi:serine hydrolase-like protein [Melitaea cinxia]|uniref:serine hydrolase-like protein n=1 Tax=Melitaea cinxia TaxID=113334 RepID=UPI001E27216F|nr:serine hydrolase-like protein [Melitaea cinxia]
MSLKQMEKAVTIKAPWGNISGITWGEPSNPPVLLAPGRIVPCSSFRPLVLKLPSSFFYVAFDFPGNGLSDHLPKGLRYTIYDLIPTIKKIVEYYKWKQFVYIAHSLGTLVGKHFNIIYPGYMSKIVDLDPLPAYHTIDNLSDWYKETYEGHYEDKGYAKHTGGKESAPKYKYDQAKQIIQKAQKLSDEAIEHIMDRYLEPAGDGLYRFTYDQRMKSDFKLPVKANYLKEMYTASATPTLAIFATETNNYFKKTPFAMDEKAWPNGNYRYKIVEGGHDVHLENPDCMADDISNFLLECKSKL